MQVVFPARAGMSPEQPSRCASAAGVPRASGDEPEARLTLEKLERCSPRERG